MLLKEDSKLALTKEQLRAIHARRKSGIQREGGRAFVEINGQKVFISNQKVKELGSIKNKFGAEAAFFPSVVKARTFEDSEQRAREGLAKRHGVSFVSPLENVEIKKGGELAGQPGVPQQMDRIFLRNLQAKLKKEQELKNG